MCPCLLFPYAHMFFPSPLKLWSAKPASDLIVAAAGRESGIQKVYQGLFKKFSWTQGDGRRCRRQLQRKQMLWQQILIVHIPYCVILSVSVAFSMLWYTNLYCTNLLVISFTRLQKVERSQSQRGVKHQVEIDDFQLLADSEGNYLLCCEVN